MDRPLSTRLQRVAPSATLAVTEKARQLRKAGVDVIALAAGEPDFDTPQHVKDAAAAALARGETKYGPTPGCDALRQAICDYLARYSNLTYRPSQICVTVGAKDALYELFQTILDPGDEVIIPAPYWVSYPDQVVLAEGRPVIAPAAVENDFKLTPRDVERALTNRTRALVLNSPSNPTGAVYSRAELEALAGALRGTSVLVVSDEIYHRLVFGDAVCTSTAAIAELADRTVTVNGVSKTYAMTGWRLGYLAGPQSVIDGVVRLQGQTNSGVATFVQYAAVAALTGDQSCVERMRSAYARRAERAFAALNAIPGVVCPRPQGAFYCFPDVSATFPRLGVRDADEFTSSLLERAHVALVSGSAFGAPAHVRISIAAADEQIEEGLRRIATFLK